MRILTLSAILVSMVLSQSLFANHSKMSGQCHKSDKACHCPFMHPKLGMTSEQKARMKQIRAQYKNQLMTNRAEVKAVKAEIRKVANAPKLDERRLNALSRKQSDLMAQRIKMKAMMRNQMYNQLTAEQKVKLDQLEAKHHRGHSH